ncbi:hypothetical protein [Magnetofaba australis]|uniref:HNH nuclease domain-containing protein n=1 Tax=Magnetofaba australis IT-1 TaxID=1434232 RepID=A0A1Y2K2E1_9PROT|nr:hypothetical protein [Magnetofaba australis]OSM02200.1 hypothetical protein MAIT1_02302 [Magnetofaba australis IT-1]
MIPVVAQPEPAEFDAQVRQPGLAQLVRDNVPANGPPPKNYKFKATWQGIWNRVLWDTYSGTCAYLAIYFEFATGASSTDHFIPKSLSAGLAYEWDNYRLSSLAPNRRKNARTILDPFTMQAGTFHLNLMTGEIYPNPQLLRPVLQLALTTISALGLDDADCRRMRVKHYDEYLSHKVSRPYFQEHSPFVYYEADRQGLL